MLQTVQDEDEYTSEDSPTIKRPIRSAAKMLGIQPYPDLKEPKFNLPDSET